MTDKRFMPCSRPLCPPTSTPLSSTSCSSSSGAPFKPRTLPFKTTLAADMVCDFAMPRSFVVYGTSSKIGSPSKMYERMTAIAKIEPVSGNKGGSFLTMWSLPGLKFGILQVPFLSLCLSAFSCNFGFQFTDVELVCCRPSPAGASQSSTRFAFFVDFSHLNLDFSRSFLDLI